MKAMKVWKVLAVLILVSAGGSAAGSDWRQWRGPGADGYAPGATPPLEWSEERNIRWKVDLPGSGSSTPIVLGDRIFLLATERVGGVAAVEGESAGGRGMTVGPGGEHAFLVLCLDRTTGRELWRQEVRREEPHEGHHRDHGYASASPVTDGERVYAHFGSRGLYALRVDDGEVEWARDLGDMRTRNGFGEGASPALSGDVLVVNWDHDGPQRDGSESFVTALDRRTGETLWRRDREEVTTWATPLVVEHDGRRQAVVSATGKVRSYDLLTGDVVWECGGQTVNVIPSPVSGFGMVYVMSGYRGASLQAIRLGHGGDLTGGEALVWSHDRGTPYVPSPLLYGELLYFIGSNSGRLSCFDARTGEGYYESRPLEGLFGVYASPLGADGRVYVAGRNGVTAVLRHGPEFEVLATNALEDGFDASPVAVDGELFLRGREYLYCVAEGSGE